MEDLGADQGAADPLAQVPDLREGINVIDTEGQDLEPQPDRVQTLFNHLRASARRHNTRQLQTGFLQIIPGKLVI